MERYQDLPGIAEKLTGLHEYGPDSFREGLEILVNAINREAQLNATGERGGGGLRHGRTLITAGKNYL